MNNPSQYLFDYLEKLENVIHEHERIISTKRYLIYRDGHLYTGTDNFNDVKRLVDNDLGLYTYKVNSA